MARKTAFTPSFLDGLTNGTIQDPLTPGLSLEVLSSGKKAWRYYRRVAGSGELVRLRLGFYPALSIADARNEASKLNRSTETGEDPREAIRKSAARAEMTVSRAHELYMVAAREGRASSYVRINRPRTIDQKLRIYNSEVRPFIGSKCIHDVKEIDLIKIVSSKATSSKIYSNRVATELMVFFKWCSGLRGLAVGLDSNPSSRLKDLKFPELPRQRVLDYEEIGWYLRGIAEDKCAVRRRGMIIWLLTAARFNEVALARTDEIKAGVWTIPAERAKNGRPHSIKLGPWGLSLMESCSDWVFPGKKWAAMSADRWYIARDRVYKRMCRYAGREIAHFTPHDFRRTARSNTKRLKVDYETAEAMLNHTKSGLERVYDTYDLEAEKAAWFLKWEHEIVEIAHRSGVARILGVPEGPYLPIC